MLPPRKPHSLGCHDPLVPDRDAMNTILFVLRTGCLMRWRLAFSVRLTGVFRNGRMPGCSSGREGLARYNALKGIDGSWPSMDGAMMSALGRLKKTGPNPTDRGKQGVKRSLLTEASGIPVAVVIDGAKRHDMKWVRRTLESIMTKRPHPTESRPQGTVPGQGL